jgi:hypothetical protein
MYRRTSSTVKIEDLDKLSAAVAKRTPDARQDLKRHQ